MYSQAMPVLEIDGGIKLSQSMAISRYLAEEFGKYILLMIIFFKLL